MCAYIIKISIWELFIVAVVKEYILTMISFLQKEHFNYLDIVDEKLF